MAQTQARKTARSAEDVRLSLVRQMEVALDDNIHGKAGDGWTCSAYWLLRTAKEIFQTHPHLPQPGQN